MAWPPAAPFTVAFTLIALSGCVVPPEQGPGPGAIPHDEEIVRPDNSQMTQQGFERFGAKDLHDRGLSGRGIRVAVIDTGIDERSNDVSAVAAKSFIQDPSTQDTTGQGTKVAGVIAAHDNDIGLLGLAPEAELLVARVATDRGDALYSTVADALRWSVSQAADIVCVPIAFNENDPELAAAVADVIASGALLFAAAGSATPNSREGPLAYPAALPGVVSVGVANRDGYVSEYALVNDAIDLFAPGEDIFGTGLGDILTLGSGVFLATAYGSGLAALVLQDAIENETDTAVDAIVERVQRMIWNSANEPPMGPH
ncbi:MAG: S8 family serine peptidase [Bifidobacteriaceae bacterium]|jgi:subtilisin family serine protease|nr:S8 family serine peptidase [Bifidobacteriaceae bacterium]